MSADICTGPLDVYLPEKPKLSDTAKKILQVEIVIVVASHDDYLTVS